MACAALALAAAGLAWRWALEHPLWPIVVAAGVGSAILMSAWQARWALWALPAALPVLSFAPWTGWVVRDEFDLLLLATIAGGYGRMCFDGVRRGWREPMASPGARAPWVALGLALFAAFTIARGFLAAGDMDFGPFAGHDTAANSWRVGKSLLFAAALWPLWRGLWLRDAAGAWRSFSAGMVTGAVVLIAAVLWERGAMPGWFDIAKPYRTVGLFWEMHVGGAAIDVYVALATPFVVAALWGARARWHWGLAAALALLWAYAVLTTFARGAYLGAAVSLLVLGWRYPLPAGRTARPVLRLAALSLGAVALLAIAVDEWGYVAGGAALVAGALMLWWRWHRSASRQRRVLAGGLLALAVLAEVAAMLGPDSFMLRRLAQGSSDYQSRTEHWLAGLRLLQTPGDWALGLGAGRLPASMDAARTTRIEMPGRISWLAADQARGDGLLRLQGPRSRPMLAGRYGITQRVPLVARYTLELHARSDRPAVLRARVCESHLLYDRVCQRAWIVVGEPNASGAAGWQHVRVELQGRTLSPGWTLLPRQAVLTLAAANVGADIHIDRVALRGPDGDELVRNGEFLADGAHWWPAAQIYFVPWHIDNLLLETVIEHGLLGLALGLGILGLALRRVFAPTAPALSAPHAVAAAAMLGALAVGAVSSVLDMPRTAWLALTLMGLCTLRVK